MLFHITHVHPAATCPYHSPDVVRETFGKVIESMTAAGVGVVGAYADAAAHTFYFVVESDSAERIQEGLGPIITKGVAETRPVTDAAATIAARA